MKTIMHPAVSVDGYIATLDGDSDSWVHPEDDARYQKAVRDCGCVLVGRKTYEQYVNDFLAYTDVVVYVCTGQPKLLGKDSIRYVSGTPEEMLNQIEQDGFSQIIICGGGDVNGLFAVNGVVNELVVSVQPVILGDGIPLFGSFNPKLSLELIATNQDVHGVVQNHYKVT